MGLDGKFVVTYCGSMAHWQRPDAVAAAFAAIQASMPDAHLLGYISFSHDIMESDVEGNTPFSVSSAVADVKKIKEALERSTG